MTNFFPGRNPSTFTYRCAVPAVKIPAGRVPGISREGLLLSQRAQRRDRREADDRVPFGGSPEQQVDDGLEGTRRLKVSERADGGGPHRGVRLLGHLDQGQRARLEVGAQLGLVVDVLGQAGQRLPPVLRLDGEQVGRFGEAAAGEGEEAEEEEGGESEVHRQPRPH